MNGVAGWFERRGELPLAPTAGLREYGPMADDGDLPESTTFSNAIGGVAFGLEYCDSRGWVSTRTIRCIGIDARRPASLKAYCTLRRTTRSFQVDRIISIMNYRTGAILSGDEHGALLAPYLAAEGTECEAPVTSLRALQRCARGGVYALLHLAMPEGRLGDGPRSLILDYVEAEAGAAVRRLPPQELVELWIDNLAPSLDSVVAAVQSLVDEKDKLARLLPWLLKIVRSQESFAVQETAIRELIAEVRGHYRRKLLQWPVRVRAIS